MRAELTEEIKFQISLVHTLNLPRPLGSLTLATSSGGKSSKKTVLVFGPSNLAEEIGRVQVIQEDI